MEGRAGRQLYYLALSQVKNLSVQKTGATAYQPIHLGTVEISPTSCHFEREGRQEFQVGEECDIIFDMEGFCLSTKATVVFVARCEMLDEGYEHKIWFSYGVEFDAELDPDLFQRLVGDPKRSKTPKIECIILS